MGVLNNLSPEMREWIEFELEDEYANVAKAEVNSKLKIQKAKEAASDAKAMRASAISIRQQSKTIDKMLEDAGVDQATKEAQKAAWSKAKLKDFGIEIP